jgi:hypothetical protein
MPDLQVVASILNSRYGFPKKPKRKYGPISAQEQLDLAFYYAQKRAKDYEREAKHQSYFTTLASSS